MKAADVVNKLANEIHKHTDLFADVYDITNMANAAGVCVVQTTAPHGLVNNNPVFITGSQVPLQISSLSRAGAVGTLITNVDHDLTNAIALTVEIAGADDAEFNGVFERIAVVNRRTITFVMANSGPTSSVNGTLLHAARYDQSLNGLKRVVSVLSPTSFNFNSGSNLASVTNSGKLKTNLRVSASASVDRAIASYTKQATTKAWLFAVLGDVRASTSRISNTDAIAEIQKQNDYHQTIIESVGIFVIANTSDDIAARRMRDQMSDVLVAITKSIAFYSFPSTFYVGASKPLVFLSHTSRTYDGVLYAHEFVFESAVDMTVEDTVGYDNDVAFRQIDMSQFPDLGGTGVMDALINLDQEEL